ncbi:MAG: 50S ribosomal protein L5 [Acidobacteria bacterium]|nr:50S ribosomal protein L5 [Acidobacteriota bacterium]
MVPRLKTVYEQEIRPKMLTEGDFGNVMAVPRLVKVSVNVGVGRASQDIKELDGAIDELGVVTGQKPVVRRAKKSIAAFKLREGLPVGCSVTLRGAKMYEFLDRLITITLPRVRDFRGVPRRSFDGRGNYTLGLKDQLIFPEVDYTRVDRTRGMNVTICTSAENDDDARALLEAIGMPFRRDQ